MDGDNRQTAKFLQARTSSLSSTLIKRVENIFAAALQTAPEPPSEHTPAESSVPPSLIETATEQFQLDIETTALIRAAEEVMVLTRTMKDLWLFGGLNTIPSLTNGTTAGAGRDGEERMDEDRRVVSEALTNYLAAVNGSGVDGDRNGPPGGQLDTEETS